MTTVTRTAAGGSFNARVWETFQRKIVDNRSAVFSVVTALFMLVATRAADFYIAHFLFFLATYAAGLSAYVFSNGRRNIFDTDVFSPRRIGWPIVFGGGISVAAIAIVVVVFRPVASATWDFYNVLLPAIVIGGTEEFARWTWLQLLPASTLTSTLLWVMLHPTIRVIFLLQIPDPRAVIVASLFGVAMVAIMLAREYFDVNGYGRYFGPVLCIVIHVVVDAYLFVYPVTVGDFSIVPF